ncbi:vitamin K epoxide reductase family protein [Luteococcus peritonei]|uniref:Vitamin K epoxide reductase family protein n=1 Tax=Luteococcus peritonei TaxID=88874 RepID=A0ABW4RTY4_9ACTN
MTTRILAPRWAWRGTAVLLTVGLLVAAYMTFEHYTGNRTLACSATGVVDCARVTTSSYSMILGIPVALAGLGWFLATIALTGWSFTRLDQAPRTRLLGAWYGLGLAFVLYLVWVELVPLGRICSWCTVVHVVTLLLFLLNLAEAVLSAEVDDRS